MIDPRVVLAIGVVVGAIWCGQRVVHGIKKVDHKIVQKLHKDKATDAAPHR